MKKPFIIGLTGSIGMGKTTTAQMFADEDIPVWDADAAVHRLYSKTGAAVAPLVNLRPEAVVNGVVDRSKLKEWMLIDPTALNKIESIVHPLVAKDRETFIQNSTSPIIVLDMPLLFEIGATDDVDYIVVVSTNAEDQKSRVMARGQMSEQQFQTILSKQLPDSEKRKRADAVVLTSTLKSARETVKEIVSKIRKRLKNA
jgi:dephospho-CoA kinase